VAEHYSPGFIPFVDPYLSDFLQQDLFRIADAIETRLDLDPTAKEIIKPREGMTRYLVRDHPDAHYGPGLYVYTVL